jgi:hypothetical protein
MIIINALYRKEAKAAAVQEYNDDFSYPHIKINSKVVIQFIRFSGMLLTDDRSLA